MKSSKATRIVLLTCMICLGATVARAQGGTARQRILIDGSASMDGFFNNDRIEQLRQAISRNQTEFDTYYFINESVETTKPEAGGFGGSTLLNNAFTHALKKGPAPAIMWIITDNQPSINRSETQSDEDLRKFYAQLQSDLVKRIYLFPLRLLFNGNLYLDKDDGSTQKLPYNDKRGLLVYALLLDEKAGADFDKAIKSLVDSPFSHTLGRDFQNISVKPLERDTITANLLPGEKFKVKDGEIIGGDFEEGRPIHGTFKLELVSQFGQIKINEATVDVKAEQFQTNNFGEPHPTPSIDPREVKNFSPGAQNKKEFTVSLDLSPAHTQWTPSSIWNGINNKRGQIDGKIHIFVNVQPQNFALVPELINEFSTDVSTDRAVYRSAELKDQQRIYKLNELVQKMIPAESVNIHPQVGKNHDGTIPVHLNVLYSNRPIVYLFLSLALLALLLLALLIWWKRRPLYRLTWDNGKYRACSDFRLGLFSGQPIDIDSRTAANIKKTFSGVKVSANRDHTVDSAPSKMINSSGADFNISRRNDGAGINFRFSRANVVASKAKGRKVDVFGGTEYSTGLEADGGVSLMAGQQPVRKPTTTREAGMARTSSSDDDHDLDSLLR